MKNLLLFLRRLLLLILLVVVVVLSLAVVVVVGGLVVVVVAAAVVSQLLTNLHVCVDYSSDCDNDCHVWLTHGWSRGRTWQVTRLQQDHYWFCCYYSFPSRTAEALLLLLFLNYFYYERYHEYV